MKREMEVKWGGLSRVQRAYNVFDLGGEMIYSRM